MKMKQLVGRMKMKQLVGRMKMKQQVGRTNGFILGFFLLVEPPPRHQQDPRGVGNGLGASRFVAKRTVQIDRQQERLARDKLNCVRIKPTIATLIQRYNTMIVSS